MGSQSPNALNWWDTVAHIHAGGITIVWIEHVVHALLASVERLVALHFGRLIADGRPHQVMASRAVQEIYTGLAD